MYKLEGLMGLLVVRGSINFVILRLWHTKVINFSRRHVVDKGDGVKHKHKPRKKIFCFEDDLQAK